MTTRPAFADLPEGARAALFDSAVEVRFEMGDVIFTAGSAADAFYVITEGRVRILRGGGGRPHVIHEERKGGAIGEVPMFEGGTYPATAVAAQPTRCLRITRETVRAAARNNPDVALALLARLAARVRTLVDQLDNRQGTGIRERLAAIIMERADRADASFSLGATHQSLAETLGTVREVVVRNLRELRDNGVITATRPRGRYILSDRAALERIAQQDKHAGNASHGG